MSPEILLGTPFDLPTDLFSLGIVFSEIASRRLADDSHFARSAPRFGIDATEVRSRASPGCPPEFVDLALDCLNENPTERPLVKDVLERLRRIELEVLARPSELDDGHVGSVKFFTAGRRRGPAPRIPSFGVGIANDLRTGETNSLKEVHSESESDDEELMQAVMGLGSVDLGLEGGWGDGQSGKPPAILLSLYAYNPSPHPNFTTSFFKTLATDLKFQRTRPFSITTRPLSRSPHLVLFHRFLLHQTTVLLSYVRPQRVL